MMDVLFLTLEVQDKTDRAIKYLGIFAIRTEIILSKANGQANMLAGKKIKD